jgi:hypothetical protein
MSSSSFAQTSGAMKRSKPIAIKASNCEYCEEDEQELELVEKQFYDTATWRLYNRIVDHRLNTPPRQNEAPINEDVFRPSPTLVAPKPRYPNREQVYRVDAFFPMVSYSSPSVDDMPIYEGEVFDLEL